MDEMQKQSFWSKVDIQKDKKSCWEWRGAKKPNGYGNIRINKKYLLAHRVAFSIINGNIPDGYMVCHICDNPACCNPSHMMLGGAKSNAIDMLIKGRQKKPESAARGEANSNSRLTANEVIKIRSMHEAGEANQYELARIFGISQSAVSSIVRKTTWRHV